LDNAVDEDEALQPAPQPAGYRKDELERLTAYGDYRRMPLAERNIKRLWEEYCERKRGGDMSVPTTTKTKVYTWAKEDQWDAKIADEERLALEAAKADALKQRKGQSYQMWQMMPAVNRRLLQIVTDEADNAIALRACNAIMDRVGIVPMSRTAAARRDLDEASEESMLPSSVTSMPGADATDTDWAAWMSAQNGGGV
jgi:hypothetical protein